MRRKALVLGLLAAFLVTGNMAKADPDHDRPMDQMHYQQWATEHPNWVRLHPDRARFFAMHPDAAEHFRSEWADWHEDRAQFNEWAEHHPGWVNAHPERAEFFRNHPEAAEKFRHEWWNHRETRREYNEWSRAHEWHEQQEHR